MDFTEIYKQSSSLVAFSPGAHFILTAVQERIIVRRTDTLQIARTWQVDLNPSPTHAMLTTLTSKSKSTFISCASPSDRGISHIGWSCDSEFILAASAMRGVVHIFKLRDNEWHGRIDSGAEGLVKAEWAPVGNTILCFSQWGLRVTLWSLTSCMSIYIQFPMHPDKGYAFRSDGRYFVLAERFRSKDSLGLYDASDSYKLVRHFPLPTSSLSSLSLSPDGNHLAVWEGPFEYKLFILNLAGSILGSFCPNPDPGFGIRFVTWHPCGTYLAVSGWDDKIYFIESISWSLVTTLDISDGPSDSVTIWREPARWLEATEGRGFLSYERLSVRPAIASLRTDFGKTDSKSGVSQLEWNISGSLLLVRLFSTPTALHIIDFPSPYQEFRPRLRTVILQMQPIFYARWNPVRKGKLALCCGGSCVYIWSDEWVTEGGASEEIAECIGVPAKKFSTRDLKWAPDGEGLVLIDKDQFCCSFEVE